MPSIVPVPRYYPRLSEVITIDDLPESLSFIKNGLGDFFGKLHYKNLQYSKSKNGDAAFYSLEIVSAKKIQIKFPFGINMVLNPDYSGGDSNISSFPIALEYQWQILAFLKSFNLNSFSFSVEDFYEVGLKIFRITDEQVLGHILNNFVEQADPQISIQQQVVNDINTFYGFTQANNNLLVLPANVEATNEMVISAIKQHPSITAKSSTLLFSIYLIDSSTVTAKEKLHKFYNNIVPEGIESYVRKLLTPKAKAVFALSAAIEFPRSILKPVYDELGHSPFDSTTGTPFSVIPASQGDFPRAQLKFAEAQFYADTEQGLGYSLDIALSLLTPVQIGNTSLILFIQNLKLDLSKTKNIEEVNFDGRPLDFMGVYIQEALIGFPKFWNHDESNSTAFIRGRRMIIGTGGISGLISLESSISNTGSSSTPATLFKLGNSSAGKHFELGLTCFDMEFKQNSIIQSNILGYMKIPGLKDAAGNDAQIDISVHIGNNGDFKITASEKQGIKLNIVNALEINIRSLSIGRHEDKWYVDISGSVRIIANIPGVGDDFKEQPFEVPAMRIWQDGSIEFIGGGISLPTHFSIKVGPVSLQIEHLGFNSHEGLYGGVNRHYMVVSFNGSIKTGSGGVDARGDGMEFHFTRDGGPFHSYLKVSGIGIDIRIPGNKSKEEADVWLSGYLAMRNGTNPNVTALPGKPVIETAGPEYQGSIAFRLKSLGVSGKGAMNMRPKVPAWIVDIELGFNTPILLGATGLGIYGFRGMLGSHYVASKTYIGLKEDDAWYDYLKKKVPPRNKQGIGIEKFDPERKGFTLGVGASVATVGDDGWTFSSKVFVMLSMPEMLLIEGQANVLHKRLGIEDENDPPFYAFLVVDSNSIQAGLGVNYNLPEGGEIMRLQGEMQMGFFFSNSSAWYLNIGKDLPEEKRIQARLFTLFNAYAYVMVNNKGIKAGAGAKFSFEKRFGPVRAGLYAYIDTKGFINFKPIQIGGAIELGGGLYLKVGRFGIEIHVAAGLSAEAPKPFIISGFLDIRIKVVIIKVNIRLEFTWIFFQEVNTEELPLLEAANIAKPPIKAVHMLSDERFDVKYIDTNLSSFDPTSISDWEPYTIPMDSFIDIEFKHPVKPYTNKFGGGINPVPEYEIFVAPQKARAPQVKHKLSVENIELKIWNPEEKQWKNYNPWSALTAAFEKAGLNVDSSNYPFGYWQYNNNIGKYTSLRLLAQTPFAVSNGTPPEFFGLLSEKILCEGSTPEKDCQRWDSVNKHLIIPENVGTIDRKLLLRFTNADGKIGEMPNCFGIAPSLMVTNGNTLEIFFNNPVPTFALKLSSINGYKIRTYAKVFNTDQTLSGLQNFSYQLLDDRDFKSVDLFEVRTFANSNDLIAKVEIEAFDCEDISLENLQLNYYSYWDNLLNSWNSDGSFNEQENSQINDWKLKYGVNPSNSSQLLLFELEPVWLDLVGHDKLSEIEVVYLNNWIDNYIKNKPEIETVLPSLCAEWSSLLSAPSDIPVLFGYIVIWQNRYCNNIIETDYERCAIYLHEVCWMTEEKWNYTQLLSENNQTLITAGINSLSESVNDALPPVWRPNSIIAVSVTTKDDVNTGGASSVTNSGYPYINTSTFVFKAGEPLGYFHSNKKDYQELERENKADQYKLANLRHYIDYQRSFPNADGKLVNAKPLYYEKPKLGLFFSKNYVYEFYTDWENYEGNEAVEYTLTSIIKDPVDLPDTTPNIPVESIGWVLHKGQQSIRVDSLEVETISNVLVNGNPNCTGITTLLKPPTLSAEINRSYNLKPQKQYLALFKVKKNDASLTTSPIVHSYPFISSKYANFRDHVLSYYRKVVFENGTIQLIKAFMPLWLKGLNLNTVVTKFQNIIDNSLPTSHELMIKYASIYDRVITGVLSLDANQAVTDTEITLIKTLETISINGSNVQKERILGILVKSSEPFNDPKLPDSEMAKTLSVLNESDGSNDFMHLFSKDNSCVFITNRDMKLPYCRMSLTFKYITYNGKAYSIDTNQIVSFRVYTNRI